jgi:DNA-binding NarL/FixJ family response regulator
MSSSVLKEARLPRKRSGPVRVLIADDHRTFAEALRAAIRLEKGLSVVAVVHDGLAAVEAVRDRRPDVALMDVEMPGTDGIAATRAIREASSGTRVIMLSAYQDPHLVARALDAGADGFLTKQHAVKDVIRSIRAAHRGEPLIDPEDARRILRHLRRRRDQDAAARERVERLTRRETEILQRMADGLSPEGIAGELGISRHTLRTHFQNVLFKLKVHSKHEALVHAIRYGKVSTDEPG